MLNYFFFHACTPQAYHVHACKKIVKVYLKFKNRVLLSILTNYKHFVYERIELDVAGFIILLSLKFKS